MAYMVSIDSTKYIGGEESYIEKLLCADITTHSRTFHKTYNQSDYTVLFSKLHYEKYNKNINNYSFILDQTSCDFVSDIMIVIPQNNENMIKSIELKIGGHVLEKLTDVLQQKLLNDLMNKKIEEKDGLLYVPLAITYDFIPLHVFKYFHVEISCVVEKVSPGRLSIINRYNIKEYQH